MKIHLYDRSTNNTVCRFSKGNGSKIEIESFREMLKNNDNGLCEHCVKYLKGSMGRLVK